MTRESPPPLEAYPLRAHDTIRFCDVDRLAHVNNAAYATFSETGRVGFLYQDGTSVAPPGAVFVIARLAIDFLSEATWPGSVEIGTRVTRIGRSSFTLAQGIFQSGRCVATAENVIVLMDEATRRSAPLTGDLVDLLARLRGDAIAAEPADAR